MNFSDIEYLLVVAERRNIGRAAEALGLTQPALTRAIGRLETLAGQSLFVRHPKGVDLTPAGQALVGRAQRIHNEYGDAMRELQDMKAGQLGLLRLGYSVSADERVITLACRQLLFERPAARLTLATAFMKTLLEQLTDGMLDLIVGPLAESENSAFLATPLYHDRLACVVDRAHPLLRRARVTLGDVAKETWLLPSRRLPVRQEFERRFSDAGLVPPVVRIESDYITPAQFKMLRGTRILAICQEDALRGLKRIGLETLNVGGLRLQRRIAVIRRANAYASPLSTRLGKLIEHAARRRAHIE